MLILVTTSGSGSKITLKIDYIYIIICIIIIYYLERLSDLFLTHLSLIHVLEVLGRF